MKVILTTGKPVGIWVRVSTDQQAKGDSPEHHERRARDLAQSRGWEVKEVYRLAGVSGKDVMGDPETSRMLADIGRGHITALIFSKLARLARSTRHLLELAELFQKANADMVALDDSIDTSTPSGRMFYTLQAAQAQWEREEIASRVAASVEVRAKMGKHMSGEAPYGFEWHKKELQLRPQEAAVRKLIHELYLEHRRRKTVARILNERGYRTRKGKLWSDTAIKWLLEDPTAKGLRRLGYLKSRGKGSTNDYRPENEWIYHPCPAIVSAELWDQTYALLTECRIKLKRPAKKVVHLLAGFVFCECGQKMYVYQDSPKYLCQKCRNKIPIKDLEECLVEQLKSYLLSPEEISRYLARADETLRSKEQELEVLRLEQGEAQKKTDRAFELYSENRLTGEQFSRVFDPLNSRLKQMGEEIPRLQATIEVLKIGYLKPDHMLAESKSLFDAWPSLNFEERRAMVENLVTRINVEKGGGLAIELAYFPSYRKLTKEQRILTNAATHEV